MASDTDAIFAQYKTYAGIAIGGVVLAAILDACTAPSEQEISDAKAAQQVAVEARRAAVENPGAAAEEKIKPIETLAVAEKVAELGPARDGAAVYQAACMACHAAGVMAAPKLEAGAWDQRIHKGLDGLTTSAINGINNMPARGGNPAITDEEMKNAVAYMLAESGYDPDAPAEDAAEAKVAAVDPAVMEEIKAAVAQATAAAEAAQASAAEAKAAAEAAQNSVSAAAGAAAVAATDATNAAIPSSGASSIGKQIYDTTCFTCHDVGIFGSPTLSDKAAWNTRIARGIDALYATAIDGNGTNTKPALGGHPGLSPAQVKAAVDYMLDTAGVNTAADAGEIAPNTSAAADKPAQETTAEEAKPEQAAPEAEAEADKPEQTAATDSTESTAAAPTWAGIDGEKVYRGICFSCHDMGIAQAPALGKATAWEARMAAGMDALYANSINGKGIMPAKGGNPALSDDEIKAAVDWMVQQIK